jgi:hypothetical protein
MSTTDDQTLALIEQVKAKKAAIASAEKPVYQTNCSFSLIEGTKSGAVNLHLETDVKKLISIAAFLVERSSAYLAAAKNVFGIEKPPEFTWDGFSVNDWLNDLKLRVTKIRIVAEKQKLEALEARLQKIISPGKMRELELEAITKELEA